MSIVIISGIVVVVFIAIYNNLVRKRNEVENAFSGIDVQLKKRYDLIPNLISTVQQLMSHEKELLENITKLRTQAMSDGLSTDEKVKIDNQLSGAMGKFNITVENYPEIKSDASFLNLQQSFNEVESQISAARRTFNAAVTAYNNAIETFPSNILAGMLSYKRKDVLEIPQEERENISAKALFKS